MLLKLSNKMQVADSLELVWVLRVQLQSHCLCHLSFTLTFSVCRTHSLNLHLPSEWFMAARVSSHEIAGGSLINTAIYSRKRTVHICTDLHLTTGIGVIFI